MNFPEMMFYAESEGLIPTRLGTINAAINELKSFRYCDSEDVEWVLNKYGLYDLTDKEMRYINESI